MNPWEVDICRLECSQAALAASDAALAKGCVKMVGATKIAWQPQWIMEKLNMSKSLVHLIPCFYVIAM